MTTADEVVERMKVAVAPRTSTQSQNANTYDKVTSGAVKIIDLGKQGQPQAQNPNTLVAVGCTGWRNGVFHPDPAYNQPSRVTYAQHAETPATVGQSDPGGVAAGEPTIRKNVNNMTADEYLKSINSSRTFQKKMDESKSR
jgi:hypothetical protein